MGLINFVLFFLIVVACTIPKGNRVDRKSPAQDETGITPTNTPIPTPTPTNTLYTTPTPTPKVDSGFLSTFKNLFSRLKMDKDMVSYLLELSKDSDPAISIAALQALLAGADQTELKTTLKNFIDNPQALKDFLANVDPGTGRFKDIAVKMMNFFKISEEKQTKIMAYSWFEKIDEMFRSGRIKDAKSEFLTILNSI